MSSLTHALLKERYFQPGEQTLADVWRRVARALSANPLQQRQLERALNEGLIPGGRIIAGAGRTPAAALLNCFVQPVPNPSTWPVHACPIFQRCLYEAATTLRAGGGVGFDLSAITSRDATPPLSGQRAPPILECLKHLEALCSAPGLGRRGGAQMAVLRCDHPDIAAFIAAKHAPGRLLHCNLSVAITDLFMRAVQLDHPFFLYEPRSPGAPALPRRQIRARALWDQLCASACAHGEPGVLFIDTIQARNNLGQDEIIQATNPCGEAPLPPYGSCALASIDLTRLVRHPFTPQAHLDWNGLRDLVHRGIECLDRVLDVTAWPLAQHQSIAQATRRVGLGMFGLADCLIMLNLRYDQPAARQLATRIARRMQHHAYHASCLMAQRLGPFPRFRAEHLLTATHDAGRLAPGLQAQIRQHGLRHAQLLAIAPTGAIAIAFGRCASRGIEPVHAWSTHQAPTPPKQDPLCAEDPAYALWRTLPATCQQKLSRPFVLRHELSAQAQVAMVAALAPYIDGAIAKTVHLEPDATARDVAGVFDQAWRSQIKGITVYRPPPDDPHTAH